MIFRTIKNASSACPRAQSVRATRPAHLLYGLRLPMLVIGLGLHALPLHAEDTTKNTKKQKNDDTPVVLDGVSVAAPTSGAALASIQPVGANAYVLNRSDFEGSLSGDNSLALLKKVPGASYTATDGLGLDISATSLFVRGFRMSEMGVTFEGVPLNDSSFLSMTGTSVVNVGVPDAVGSIDITPGSARESLFSSSANGGGIAYALVQPSATAGATVKQAYGSNRTLVTTLSGQTGKLGENGPEIVADLQRVSANKYQAAGTQHFLRGDLKVKQDVSWGDFTFFFSGSHAEVWGYNNLSFDMIRNLGWKADSRYPNYADAYNAALPENADASCGVYTCGKLTSLLPYDTGQTTSDYIESITHHFRISPDLSGSVQLYGANSKTYASLADPNTPSPTGAPFSEQVQSPKVNRFGGMLNFTYTAGNHTLTAGFWQERTNSDAKTSWYNEPLLGQGAPLNTTGPYTTYGPAFQIANASHWRTRSRQFYLHDDYAINDELTLGMGFKGVSFSTTGGGIGADQAPYGTLRVKNNFLPHLSLFWSPTPQTDVFVDLAESENGYRVAQRGNIGYTASVWTVSSQDEFDKAVQSIRPESDWNLTAGVAHRFDNVTLTYDAFYSVIRNRLLSAAVGSQFAQVNTVGVMPRMHIFGSDLGLTADLSRHVQVYQGVAVARSFYDRDFAVDGNVFPIKGKAQPGYPIVSLVTDVSAHFNAWRFGATSTEYLRQPFSYENDIYVPNYWQVNAYASYTLPARGNRPELSFRLDASNLINRKNIGTATIAGSPFSGDYQTLQRSAPRQVLFSVSARY
ncbi:TonB-dependent receptor [Rothia nasimurium]|nr:TonB-dependent receptor [Luteibacter anthropi]